MGPSSNRSRVRVSVVIPTWNGKALLHLPLDSLQRQTHATFETIVVDDASTDGTAAWVEERYPGVRVVSLPENRGFAGAVNAGIRAATGEAVAFLNNDAEADCGWLAAMVDALAAHPEAGMVACRVLLYHADDFLDSAGIYASTVGSVGNLGAYERDGLPYRARAWVLGPSGAAGLYRSEVFADVGLLDESLIAYYEDTDIAIRAQLRGWKCIYEPTAVCRHVGSASYGALSLAGNGAIKLPASKQPHAAPASARVVFYATRNYPAIPLKFLPLRVLLADFWALAAYELNLIRYAAVHGKLTSYLSGRLAFFRVAPTWLSQRRILDSSRTVSRDDVVRLFRRPRLGDYLRILWRRSCPAARSGVRP